MHNFYFHIFLIVLRIFLFRSNCFYLKYFFLALRLLVLLITNLLSQLTLQILIELMDINVYFVINNFFLFFQHILIILIILFILILILNYLSLFINLFLCFYINFILLIFYLSMDVSTIFFHWNLRLKGSIIKK